MAGERMLTGHWRKRRLPSSAYGTITVTVLENAETPYW